MNKEQQRGTLMVELEEVLDLHGANPGKWPEHKKARLSAFVETDDEAMKLFAQAKAFDLLLGCCRKGQVRPGLEKSILATVCNLPQQHRPFSVQSFPASRTAPIMPRRGGTTPTRHWPWREAALLAASLAVGIYIGLSGEALPTLRDLNMVASADMTAGAAIAGSLLGPSGLHDQEPL